MLILNIVGGDVRMTGATQRWKPGRPADELMPTLPSREGSSLGTNSKCKLSELLTAK